MKVKSMICAVLTLALCSAGFFSLAEAEEKINTIIDASAKSTKTYYFTSDVTASGGSKNTGDITEWKITDVPQYFYVDTVGFDTLDTITVHAGHGSGEGIYTIYAYDNGGEAVTKEQLQGLCSDPAPLGAPAAKVVDTNEGWGYSTIRIDSEQVEIVSDSKGNYVLNSTESAALNIPEGTGKKALIIGFELNGSSKPEAYFDYMKVDFSEFSVLGARGDGIKDHTVEVDAENHTIMIPVLPGTDISSIKPALVFNQEAEAEMISGTWEEGVIQIKHNGTVQEWSVKMVDRGNPVLNGYYADPNIICLGDTFYIYPTTDGGVGWNSSKFNVFSSKDLVNWNDEGKILDLADVPWTGGERAWAPAVIEKNGKYYFYYSGNGNIGVAWSDSPTGPFIDKGEPLVVKGTYTGQMIDPAVFTDDDGQSYLYWGNGRLYVSKLSDDMMGLEGEVKMIRPSVYTEGAFVFKRDGKYYFMWSCNDTGDPKYEVRYGVSNSPMGPISGTTKILTMDHTNDPRIRGTGHHSVVNIPGTDEWYICYHRFNIPGYGNVSEQNAEAGNHREVCIDKMNFDENGNILPVTATLEGIRELVEVSAPPAQIKSVSLEDGKIRCKVNNYKDSPAYDVYTALYDQEGALLGICLNGSEAEFAISQGTHKYTIKNLIWEKDTMKPYGGTEDVTVYCKDITMQTIINKQLVLPGETKVYMNHISDGRMYPINWDAYDIGLLQEIGAFDVYGTVAGTGLRVKCTVNVRNEFAEDRAYAWDFADLGQASSTAVEDLPVVSGDAIYNDVGQNIKFSNENTAASKLAVKFSELLKDKAIIEFDAYIAKVDGQKFTYSISDRAGTKLVSCQFHPYAGAVVTEGLRIGNSQAATNETICPNMSRVNADGMTAKPTHFKNEIDFVTGEVIVTISAEGASAGVYQGSILGLDAEDIAEFSISATQQKTRSSYIDNVNVTTYRVK